MLRTFERVVLAIAAGNDLDLVLTGLTRDELGRLTPRRPSTVLAPSRSSPNRQVEGYPLMAKTGDYVVLPFAQIVGIFATGYVTVKIPTKDTGKPAEDVELVEFDQRMLTFVRGEIQPPIVIPPNTPGSPENPIILPGTPTHPIATPPARPDAGLPTTPGAHPDAGLPTTPGARPGNELPGTPGARPDNELPGTPTTKPTPPGASTKPTPPAEPKKG